MYELLYILYCSKSDVHDCEEALTIYKTEVCKIVGDNWIYNSSSLVLARTMFRGEEGRFRAWRVLRSRRHQLDWPDVFVCHFLEADLSGMNQGLHRAVLLKRLLYMSLKHSKYPQRIRTEHYVVVSIH